MTQRESVPSSRSAHFERHFKPLLQNRALLLAAEAAGTAACHLVGGALRDAALGLQFRDLDLVIERDGLSFAHRVAALLPARVVELGGDRFAAYRLVAVDLTIDIWDRQGARIEADLERRDLTIHSFAVGIPDGAVIDPFRGLVDLEDRVLRATSETSFSSDPLRVLRLVRFAGQLPDFTISNPTLRLAADSAAALDRVAPERIRIELEHLLELPGFPSAAELLVRLSLYPDLMLPHPRRGSSRTAPEMLSRLSRLELLADHTREPVDRALVRLAILLAQLPLSAEQRATDAVESAQQKGLLTRATARRLKRLLAWEAPPRDSAGQRWLLHRSGDLWPTVTCFLATGDQHPWPVTEYQEYLAQLEALRDAYGNAIFDPEWLIDGTDLVSHLGLKEGKKVGRILSAIQRQQVEGLLATRADALKLAEQLALEQPEN